MCIRDRVQGTGYHIEKIIFESKPGGYVTAHLYMPENRTVPVPATLELCGHGLNDEGSSSHAAMLMASNGNAVLVVDPIGQGERLPVSYTHLEERTKSLFEFWLYTFTGGNFY